MTSLINPSGNAYRQHFYTERLSPPLYVQEMAEIGADSGNGNLLGIQPFMRPEDYASAKTLHEKLSDYLQLARQHRWLNEKTVVLFPEYIGTWLVAENESSQVYRAHTINKAMRKMILAHTGQFLRTLFKTKGKDKTKDALFRMKAADMAQSYQRVLASLAEHYRVAIVAGSIVLPTPEIDRSRLKVGDGPLQNVSVLFHPNGRLDRKIVRKVYPIADELPFTAPARPEELPVFITAIGHLGVLICADSWYPECYLALKRQGVERIAVPSYLAPDGAWERPWQGYDGAAAPADVSPADIRQIRERDAWLKYALAGRLPSARGNCGMNVFLRGKLWDLGSDGCSIVVHGQNTFVSAAKEGAALLNLWMPA